MSVHTVLRAPQVSRVLIASQVGRLPLASGPLALLLFARQSLSLTAAGLLVAAYTAAMAVSTPLLARTVDRWRQPPVLWASALVSGAGFVIVAAGGHRVGPAPRRRSAGSRQARRGGRGPDRTGSVARPGAVARYHWRQKTISRARSARSPP